MHITQFFLIGLLSVLAPISIVHGAYVEDVDNGVAIYANGGIGQEEADEMRANAGRFNLRLYLSEGKYGQSIADAKITITDKKGSVVLDEPSGGPMLFTQVANGRYTINAVYSGITITRKVTVLNRRGANVYLTWKATDTDRQSDAADAADVIDASSQSN